MEDWVITQNRNTYRYNYKKISTETAIFIAFFKSNTAVTQICIVQGSK